MRKAEDTNEVSLADATPPKKAAFVNLMLGCVYSLESIGYFGKAVNELLAEAQNGNRAAFPHAVSIDRTVVGTQMGPVIVAQAQLRQDKAFLSGL